MNLFVCYLCGYQSKHKSNLRAHMAVHSGERPAFESWDYQTPSPPHLKTPTMTNSDVSSACESFDSLNGKMRKHGGKKSYKCESCDYKTGSASKFKAHMNLHASENERTLWGYKQDRVGVLNTLFRSHSGKTYDCRSCSFKCNGMASLMSHKKIHTRAKSHAFSPCDHRRSGFLSLLRRSMTPSFGPKRYGCDLCDHEANQSERSSTLMRACNEKKPLACGSCDYACNDACTEKSFACGSCDYRCEQACRKKPDACDSYEYSCIRTDDLKRFMITQSGERGKKYGSQNNQCIQAEQFRRRSKFHGVANANPYGFFDFPYNQAADMSTLARSRHLEQPYAVVLVTDEPVPRW